MEQTYHYLAEEIQQARRSFSHRAPINERPANAAPRLSMAQRIELARWERAVNRPLPSYRQAKQGGV